MSVPTPAQAASGFIPRHGFMPVPVSIADKRKKKMMMEEEYIVGNSNTTKSFLRSFTPTVLSAQPARRGVGHSYNEDMLKQQRDRAVAEAKSLESNLRRAEDRLQLSKLPNVDIISDFLYQNQGSSVPTKLLVSKFGLPEKGGGYSRKELAKTGEGFSASQRRDFLSGVLVDGDLVSEFTRFQEGVRPSTMTDAGRVNRFSSARRPLHNTRTRHVKPRDIHDISRDKMSPEQLRDDDAQRRMRDVVARRMAATRAEQRAERDE